MRSRAVFLSDAGIDELFYRGELSFAYSPPYSDMPSNFADTEITLFKRLETALLEEFAATTFDVGYDTWADLVIRMSIDATILNHQLLEKLDYFIQHEAADHLVFCIVEDFDKEIDSYLGRLVITKTRLIVSTSIKDIWLENLGADFELPI